MADFQLFGSNRYEETRKLLEDQLRRNEARADYEGLQQELRAVTAPLSRADVELQDTFKRYKTGEADKTDLDKAIKGHQFELSRAATAKMDVLSQATARGKDNPYFASAVQSEMQSFLDGIDQATTQAAEKVTADRESQAMRGGERGLSHAEQVNERTQDPEIARGLQARPQGVWDADKKRARDLGFQSAEQKLELEREESESKTELTREQAGHAREQAGLAREQAATSVHGRKLDEDRGAREAAELADQIATNAVDRRGKGVEFTANLMRIAAAADAAGMSSEATRDLFARTPGAEGIDPESLRNKWRDLSKQTQEDVTLAEARLKRITKRFEEGTASQLDVDDATKAVKHAHEGEDEWWLYDQKVKAAREDHSFLEYFLAPGPLAGAQALKTYQARHPGGEPEMPRPIGATEE